MSEHILFNVVLTKKEQDEINSNSPLKRIVRQVHLNKEMSSE
jgi:hypothetical protein